MAHDADFRRELGPAAARRLGPRVGRRRLGPSHVLDVRRRPDGRPDRRPSAAGLRAPAQPGQRPPDLLQGPRLAAVLLGPQGGRGDRRRGAADVPQARLAARGPPDAAHPADRRGHRLARPGPADRRRRRDRRRARWTGCPTACGCLCGDSEMAEGSMWEAFQHAGWEGLDNLVAIIDVNRLGQTRETMLGWDVDGYVAAHRGVRLERDRDRRPRRRGDRGRPTPRPRRTTGKPTAIVARTKKGKGVKAVEDQPGKHGKPLDDPEEAIAGARRRARPVASTWPSPRRASRTVSRRAGGELPTWELGDEVATRKAYGESHRRARRTIRGDVVALDGEVSNSTHSEDFREAHPDRYFEMFIAEQQLVAAAVGMQVRGWTPFASTFAAFFSRAYDFVRMARDLAGEHPRCRGSHAGVSIGEDGPSQMALEDIASLPRDPRLDRPAPERRQPDREARRGDGRPRRASRSCARCAARPRCAPRRTRSCAIGGSRDRPRGRRRRDHRLRHHARRGRQGGRAARRRGRPAPACSTATRSSRSTPRPSAPRRASAARSSPSRTTGPRAGWATPCSRRWPRATSTPHVVKLAVREMPGSGTPEELLHAAGIDAEAIADAAAEAGRRRCRPEPVRRLRTSDRGSGRSRRRGPLRGRGPCTGTGRRLSRPPLISWVVSFAPQTAQVRAMVSSRLRSSRSMPGR